MTRNHWGKAGVRLTPEQVAARRRHRAASANRAELRQAADDQVAYQLWRHGLVVPARITAALDIAGLYGPDVDTACGAQEPDVDLWEAGVKYPTWQQVVALAALTGKTPRYFTQPLDAVDNTWTTLAFHTPGGWTPERRVVAFTPDAIHATVGGAQ